MKGFIFTSTQCHLTALIVQGEKNYFNPEQRTAFNNTSFSL